MKEVKESVLPELDDEFAKDISEFETLDALRESIRTRLLEYRTRAADEGFESALTSQVVESIEGEIPACMFEEEADKIMQDYSYRLQSQGMRMEDYLSLSGTDAETFKKTLLPQAETRVKTTLAMEAIVRQEHIEVTEEECAEEIKKLAEQYKMKEDEVRKYLDETMLKADIANRKAMDLVRESAVKTAPDAAEKPKKTRAKKAEPKAETPAEEKPKAAKAAKPKAEKPAEEKPKAAKTAKPKAEKPTEEKPAAAKPKAAAKPRAKKAEPKAE